VKPDPAIAAARAEVERSRARLMRSAHALQDRLSPRTLARGAWDGAKEKGAELAEDAVDAVRSRPMAATGVVGAILTIHSREPVMDHAGQLASAVGGKRKERKKSKTKAKIKARTKDMEAAQ
jgi:hypothetical protein